MLASPLRHAKCNIRDMHPAATRKLRVLTLIDNPDITGGGERMAVTIALQLDPERFERILCATREVDAPSFAEELDAAGVRVLPLKRQSKWALWAWWPLIELLRREQIDVLHAHKFGSNVWGTVIGRLARVPVVLAHEQSWASARFSAAWTALPSVRGSRGRRPVVGSLLRGFARGPAEDG